MSVHAKEGQAPLASFGPRKHVISPGRFSSVGYPRFVRSKLSQLGNGCFTIRCVLVLQNESSPLELPGRLERMLGDGTGADVTFRVHSREFRAHRSILAAQSPLFHAQFFGPMMEKDMPRVEVIDVDPTIFGMLLHYIYTDSLPPSQGEGGQFNVSVMQHLLVAADKYGVDRLRLMCEEQLCDMINMDMVKTMLALANQHSCKQLKEACLAFMASPQVLGAILETDGFKEHFMMDCRPLPLEWGTSSPDSRR
ncbi:hypothetical protein QYE76_046361 [Lolium multiflorum]|uniref:BTB domain-containing protein n=1 Tax=Lolium multiflorum TaxID=4521 RepID=A0AAD8TPD7_LOLMU|nr:hypothetical protein QYE76_046361 [Lolium multiflorum]